MNRAGHEDTDFFLGTEVEHSPALGKKTLFVVGVQSAEKINSMLANSLDHDGQTIDHIYFGANHSFLSADQCNAGNMHEWTAMILPYLNNNMWCTLDFDVSCVEAVMESGLDELDTFIPMVSVKMPYIQLLNYNTTIKLDDRDFRSTNPGVWCHSLHQLMDRRVFTNWLQYTKDTVL
jgi:hypothetical protein